MALETLRGINTIGGVGIAQFDGMPAEWDEQALKELAGKFIIIDHSINVVQFQIQQGPIKENGVNGCRVDHLIRVALEIIKAFNDKFPHEENKRCLGFLSGAIGALENRKNERQKRGVEGTSQA